MTQKRALSVERVAELVEDARSGISQAAAAEKYGASVQTLHRYLRPYELGFRSGPSELRLRVEAALRDGKQPTVVARETGSYRTYVQKVKREMGLTVPADVVRAESDARRAAIVAASAERTVTEMVEMFGVSRFTIYAALNGTTAGARREKRAVDPDPVEPIRRPKKVVKEREKTVCGPRKHPWVAVNIRVTDGGSLMCFQCARREALKRMPEYMRKLAVS